MAAGIPVVARAVGGVPDLIKSGTTGILIEGEDAESVGEALVHLATHEHFRQQMGAACEGVVRNDYHQRVVIPKYYELYEALLRS
jgi:glycosyltransferase involved in cell wall biosynthesis